MVVIREKEGILEWAILFPKKELIRVRIR